MEKEIRFFGGILDAPERPFTAVLGGSKVGDKIPLIENLIDKVDTIIVGGGMAYTFLKAMGKDKEYSVAIRKAADEIGVEEAKFEKYYDHALAFVAWILWYEKIAVDAESLVAADN